MTSPVRKIPSELRNKTARELIILGFNTLDIAADRKADEAEIYNEIGRQRRAWIVPRKVG